MSEERPETCEMCGAPVVWCKCGTFSPDPGPDYDGGPTHTNGESTVYYDASGEAHVIYNDEE